MIYIVIGSTCSGKSTLVKNTFIRNREPVLKRDLIPYCELDDCILIGNYLTGKRRVGTDMISKSQLGLMGQQVKNLINLNKDIVLEGMRCVSRPLVNYLIQNKLDCCIIWVDCGAEESFNRANKPSGNTGNPPNFKLVSVEYVKCRNFYNDFKGLITTKRIDSTDVDWNTFTLSTCKYVKEKSLW